MEKVMNLPSQVKQEKGRGRGMFAKAATAIGASLFSVAAWAQSTDVGGAISAELTNAKDKVNGNLILLAGIVGLLILWAYLKRAH